MRSGAREMMALRWSAVCLGLRRRRRSLGGIGGGLVFGGIEVDFVLEFDIWGVV